MSVGTASGGRVPVLVIDADISAGVYTRYQAAVDPSSPVVMCREWDMMPRTAPPYKGDMDNLTITITADTDTDYHTPSPPPLLHT